MSLAAKVFNFLRATEKNPGKASDPDMRAMLLNAARLSADDRAAALYAPIAPWTYEVDVELSAAITTTQRIPFQFPTPNIEIVGMFVELATITTVGGVGTTVATPADVRVVLDVNMQEWLSVQNASVPGLGQLDANAVKLSSLGTPANPRLMKYVPSGPRPELGFQFSWAVDGSAAGRNFYRTLVSVCMFVRRYPKEF